MTYTDYTDFPETYIRRRGAGGGGLPFPVKLFVLLKYIDLKEPNMQTIFSWNRHGRSFKIHDLNSFQLMILPRFFPSSTYETFRRQLNFWGFKRHTGRRLVLGQSEYGSYYHQKFLRSKDYLCRLIERKKYSSKRTRQRSAGSDLSSSSGQDTSKAADHQSNFSSSLTEEGPDFSTFRTMPLSEQSRLEEPESDDDLFALLLTKTDSNNCNSNDNSTTSVEMPGRRTVAREEQTSTSLFSNNRSVLLEGQFSASGGRSNNTSTTSLDDRYSAYRNIDLQRILSDENEWQWRPLEPFSMGTQPPPPTQDEVEELDRFMKFVRDATSGQS